MITCAFSRSFQKLDAAVLPSNSAISFSFLGTSKTVPHSHNTAGQFLELIVQIVTHENRFLSFQSARNIAEKASRCKQAFVKPRRTFKVRRGSLRVYKNPIDNASVLVYFFPRMNKLEFHLSYLCICGKPTQERSRRNEINQAATPTIDS
ncbi:hypothetical protein HUU05_05980 [candidate division KSB1 bacterium]|nr:hypothetical protein [candidate division KSB1 bacterium]